MLINNFNDLIEHEEEEEEEEDNKCNKQQIPFTSSIQNLFQFGSFINNQQQLVQSDDEDEILRKLLLKLKKFSNKLKKPTNKKKRSIKIKRKKLILIKKTTKKVAIQKIKKIVSSSPKPVFTPQSVIKQSYYNDSPIAATSTRSSKIKKLLDDSRGIGKYMIDYDISTSSLSSSALNTTTKYFFDSSFDNRQLKLQFEQLEQQLILNIQDQQLNENDNNNLIKLEYSFNDDNDTLIKTGCSSGYLSDF